MSMFFPTGSDEQTEWDNRPAIQTARSPRQPHFGSTALVLVLFGIIILVVGVVVVLLGRKLHALPDSALATSGNPRLSILIELAAYSLTALAAYPILRTLWQRPVGPTLDMNWPAARRYALPLVGTGLLLAVGAQLIASRMSLPKDMPIDKFFTNSADVWLMAIFGTFIAPLAEEIAFRGFLLRSFAIAFDWTRHFLGEPERKFWQNTDDTSPQAWVVGAVCSSALFAAMHAAQLGWAWNAVSVLSIVGLILSAVRIRLRSVWASTLLHMGYNGLLFLLVFFATDGFRHLDKIKR